MAASEDLASARAPRSVTRGAGIWALVLARGVGGCGGFDTAGADDVANGADAHNGVLDLLAVFRRDQVVHGEPLALAAHAFAGMAEVDARHFESLFADVFPHVHLGPVAEREDAHVL